MKTLHLGMIVVFGFIIFFLSPSDSYASTCAVQETIYSAPQFFLLSDSVFAGTVTSITDYGNHQWQVHFDIEKIWKGVATRQTSTVMTGTLQACGYSIVVGEKYLIYTNGSPSFINPIDSKMYSDAQNEIALFDDPKFQSQEKVKEDLNKKLEIAQGRVGSMMMDKLYHIPISAVGVDQVNSTLDIVINDQKATLSLEQYRQSLQDILGNIPIKVEFGYATASAPILHSVNDHGQTTSYPIIHGTNSSIVLKSPLKQFKSGIKPSDITCQVGLQPIIKSEDNSPACVKPNTAQKLVERNWGMLIRFVIQQNNSIFSIQTPTNETIYHDYPNPPEYSIIDATQGIAVNDDTEASNLTGFVIKSPTHLPQGYNVKLIKASKEIPMVTIFVSKYSLTDNTSSHDFLWNQRGILISYQKTNPHELENYKQFFAHFANKTIAINGTPIAVFDISKRCHDGYPYDMWGSLIAIKDNNTNIAIRGFFNSDDLIKIATSMLEK